jgi:hypothetical protein
MSWDDAFKLASAIIAATGGGAVIILGFSSWLAKIWANRILESDRAKYQSQLEILKSDLSLNVERLKSDLLLNIEISKRFTEKQFYLYNDLWSSLCDLRIAGDNLWERANTSNAKKFADQLKKTEDQILRSSLLIEDLHYENLMKLIDKFNNFRFGKTKLAELRRNHTDEETRIISLDIKDTIDRNELLKEEYSQLIKEIESYFKRQIQGIK